MKKLFLFLLIGLFLISFTSASYTIEKLLPYTAPTITVTNVSGGGWAEGSYKFVAMVGKYYGYSFWNPGIRTSPASNVFEINLSEGDGIQINYTNLDPNAPKIYFEGIKVTAGNDRWRNVGETSGTKYEKGYLVSSYPTDVTVLDDVRFNWYNTQIKEFS